MKSFFKFHFVLITIHDLPADYKVNLHSGQRKFTFGING